MTTQEAIEYIKAHCNPDYPNGKTEWETAMNMAIDALKSFENDTETKSYSKDTISRQAAIDLVRDVCDAVMSGCESWYDPDTGDEVYKDILEVDSILKCNKEIRIALRSMPSAQSEIIRCKDCKHYQGDDSWLHCNRVTWINGEDDFCSRAERKDNG